MDTRREFIKKASLLSGGAGLLNMLPASIAKALAIDPQAGSTFMDAEHIVFLMQENRSFDHTYGSLQGVRGFNDPRAITLPDKKPVWYQTNNKGETYAPFRFDIKNTNATWMESLPHGWTDQVDAWNKGKFDKWLDTKHSGLDKYRAMPLTLGFYTREDIPFYYSLADAFTVCDHNFCSSLTGTTANRLYFWTGTIREKKDENAIAHVWNDDADFDSPVSWKTFPERLEEHGVSWKVYQNEISAGSPLKDEEDQWLGNFGDNPLEYFTQYKVRTPSEQLSGRERSIHDNAFATNKKDPAFHELTTIRYKDGDTEHETTVPKGDVLFQFREDVKTGNLPTVSWIVAPQKFSDHPSSPWYGAWYISEAIEILTENPEVWKKTIFILTYDENDGYFDHVPPFTAPHPHEGTGAVSKSIDTRVEYVSDAKQQTSEKKDARIAPIGLGYRVPMVIASPWSRGGWVNSQVFDHTSSLLFLEKFLSGKFRKKVHEPNISTWRRAVCGDLTSAFRQYNGEKINTPEFLERDEFIEQIHKAQFRNPPSNFKKLSPEDIEKIKRDPFANDILPVQEKGTRESNALPYELYADAKLSADRKSVLLRMEAGNKIHGDSSAGSPFNVYAPGVYQNEPVRAWAYAVSAGEGLSDSWEISDFENNLYHLRVYGPNGFYREFKGSSADPMLEVVCLYEKKPLNPDQYTGNLILQVKNNLKSVDLELLDNSYKTGTKNIKAIAGKVFTIPVDVSKSFGWYDFSLKLKGNQVFEKRFAGRAETGKSAKTDPAMGKVI